MPKNNLLTNNDIVFRQKSCVSRVADDDQHGKDGKVATPLTRDVTGMGQENVSIMVANCTTKVLGRHKGLEGK